MRMKNSGLEIQKRKKNILIKKNERKIKNEQERMLENEKTKQKFSNQKTNGNE